MGFWKFKSLNRYRRKRPKVDASFFDSALSHTRRSEASEKREENSVSTFGCFRLWTSFESSPVSVKWFICFLGPYASRYHVWSKYCRYVEFLRWFDSYHRRFTKTWIYGEFYFASGHYRFYMFCSNHNSRKSFQILIFFIWNRC